MLQLHPNFDMKALEILFTLEVTNEVVNEVEKEVVAAWRIASTSRERTAVETGMSAEALEIVEVEVGKTLVDG